MRVRVSEWRTRVLLVLCSTGIALGAAEVAARILVRPAPPRGPGVWELSRTLGWRPRPNSVLRIGGPGEEFESSIAINAHGLRGPDIPYRAAPLWRRLAIVGDSFVYGVGVSEEDSLTGRLGRALKACRVDVVNGSEVGYSTDQEWLYYNEEIRKYGPSEVVLLFFFNDLAPNVSRFATGRSKPMFVLRDGELELIPPVVEADPRASFRTTPVTFHHSALWQFVADRLSRRRPDWVRTLARFHLAPEESLTFTDQLPFGPMGPAEEARVEAMWSMTAALLGRFRDDVVRDGARFSVFYVPSPFEARDAAWLSLRRRYGLERPWRRDTVRARLSRLLADMRIPLFDVSESFVAAEAAGDAAYFPNDGHWNARGHEIAFDALLKAMRRSFDCGA